MSVWFIDFKGMIYHSYKIETYTLQGFFQSMSVDFLLETNLNTNTNNNK